MAIKLKTDKAIELYKGSGGTIGFENSLRDVFDYASKDKRITNKKQLAYLLATAKKKVIILFSVGNQIICVVSKVLRIKTNPAKRLLTIIVAQRVVKRITTRWEQMIKVCLILVGV
jgi:hypothetical protein